MQIVVNFVYIFKAISDDRVENISNNQKQKMKKIRKSKINCYDISQILHDVTD